MAPRNKAPRLAPIYSKLSKRTRAPHEVIVEQILGRALPKGIEVHHWDMNPKNNSHSNLLVCPSREYHELIHRRMRALEACGHADWEKCRYCKRWDHPSKMHAPKGSRANGKNKPSHLEHCGVIRRSKADQSEGKE